MKIESLAEDKTAAAERASATHAVLGVHTMLLCCCFCSVLRREVAINLAKTSRKMSPTLPCLYYLLLARCSFVPERRHLLFLACTIYC